MDRSFFEQPGKRILLDKCSFSSLLHSNEDLTREFHEKALDAQTLGLLEQTVLPKIIVFLTFGAHFLCLINSMCYFLVFCPPSKLKQIL